MNKKITFDAQGNHWQVYVRDEADLSVFNEIFKLHEYRIADEVIRDAIYPIVDMGAHAGFFTLYARSLNKNIDIYAIEPESENIKQFNYHMQENHIDNVYLYPGALSEQSGLRILEVAPDSHNHRLTYDTVRDVVKVSVDTLSFADFCTRHQIGKISLLKIDIEGGEYEVFEGVSSDDLARVQYIVMEYHGGRKKSEEIEEKLRMHGFGVQVFPSKFDKTMGFFFAHNKRFTK